jgi:thymidylate kinase
MNIIIEGTDGCGKTTTIEALKTMFPKATFSDRNHDTICKYMLKDVPMETRVDAYHKFLKDNDVKVMFLINNDGEELLRRIKTRDKPISDFDLDAPLYNDMYRETFEVMNRSDKTEGKLFMVDVTGLSMADQINKVKETIEQF